MSATDLAWLVQANPGADAAHLAVFESVLAGLRALRDADSSTVEWYEALKTLVVAIDSGTRPPQIEAAAWSALTAEWAALRSRVTGALPEALRPLTFKLSDLLAAPAGGAAVPGLLEYPLTTSAQAGGSSVAGGLVFATTAQAGATGSVALQVYGVNPDWAVAAGYVLPAGECLVRLGLHGQLAGDTSARGAPVWGSVGIDAGASASAALDWCFNAPASRYVAQVLVDSVPDMAAPGDLAGLLHACASPDFAFCLTELDGRLSIGGELAFGQSFVSTVVVPDANAGLGAVTLTADAGLKAGFEWALAGGYRVVARRAGSAAQVRVERTRSSTTGGSISLGIDFDVQGLQARLDPILQKALPSSQALAMRLGRLTDLRGLALAALQKRLGLVGGDWDAVANALLAPLLSTGAPQQAASAGFVATLAAKFDAFAKATLGGVQAQIDAASAAVALLVQGAFGGVLPAGGATLLDGASRDIKAAVDTAYAGFLAQAAAAVGEIANTLSIPSGGAGTVLADLQARTDTIMPSLLQWIGKYELLRTRIANAIALVEREKVALSWAHQYQRERDTTSIVEVLFIAPTSASAALYGAMRAGRLGRYHALIAACQAEGSATELQWILTEGQTRKSTDALTFSFFGLDTIGATTTALDRIAISVDSSGRIVGASDSVHLDQVLTARSRLTRASLDLNLEMLAAAGSVPLASTFSASGDTFTLKDETDFFGLLTRSAAIGPTVASQVKQLLWSGTASAGATLTNAELSVSFEPDDDGWQRLLAIAPDALGVAVRANCLALLALAREVGTEDPWPDGTPRDWLARWLAGTRLDEAGFWGLARANQWSGLYNALIERLDDNLAEVPSASTPRSPEQAGVQALWQMFQIGQATATAWTGLAQVAALLARLRGGSPPLTREAAFKQLSDLSDGVRNALSRVFSTTLADRGRPTKVNWQYLALITTLADVASGGAGFELVTKAKARIGGVDVAWLVV